MSDPEGPKKETVRITLPPRVRPGESRETVRVNMPPRPAANGTPAQSPPRPPPPGSPLRSAPPSPPSPAPPPLQSVSSAAPLRPPVLTRTPPPPLPPSPVVPPPVPVVLAAAATPVPETPVILAAPPPMPPRPRVLPPPPRVPPSVTSGSVSAAPAIYPGSVAHPGPKKETARISILPQPAARPSPTVKMTKTQPLLTVPQANIHSARVTVTADTARESVTTSFDSIPLPICWTIFGISTVILLIHIWTYLVLNYG